MHEIFRSLAVHNAHAHRRLLENLSAEASPAQFDLILAGTVYDGLWLTKFPLLFTPSYGVKRLDALNKRWALTPDLEELKLLRPLVDADVLRFVLRLGPADLESRVELFFGGRALNKALWQYLLVWFEHDATARGRLGSAPDLLETVFT